MQGAETVSPIAEPLSIRTTGALPLAPRRAIVVGMTAVATIPSDNRTSLPANPPKDAKTPRVTGKNKVAIEAMVFEGLNRRDAAAKAGLTDHSLYVALSKPHCKAFYMSQLDVLRTSERARDIHTLNEVRDQTSNQMARVAAVKTKWQIEDGEVASRGAQSLPGLQIVIVQGGSQSSIDAQLTRGPVIDNE